jgi:Zn-dependent protease with chaperone function
MSALPYLLHGTTLALAWFLLLNVATTAAVAIVSARLTKRVRAASPGFWLALRLFPAALSIGFVAMVFLPSYWRYEPREFVEGFDVTLALLAVLALAVIGTGTVRGVSAWRRAACRTDRWLRVGRPLTLTGTSMPAFAIDTDVPVMALVGVLHPRLLIARPVLDALTEEELRAGVAHELGHWRAWDNLKRLAMRAAPDLLSATFAARALERRWAADSEHVADRGAGESGRVRCALASALVKVARMTPAGASIAEATSALVDGADVTARVQRLLDDAPSYAEGRSARLIGLTVPAFALALLYTPLLQMVHDVTEILVNTLP